MKVSFRTLAACAFVFGGLTAQAEPPSACAGDPRARGISERMGSLRGYIERIERGVERSERRRLMEIHLQAMRENMRELRSRAVGEECRIETMQAMMEQMLRHQIAAQEVEER